MAKLVSTTVVPQQPLSITRKVEFDAGHRIPNHASKCRNIHGHRYVLECTVTGSLVATQGASDEAMLIDFGQLKAIMQEHIAEPWDHALLVWDQDWRVIKGLANMEMHDHKTVLLPCIPTVEELAACAFHKLVVPLSARGLLLHHLRLYETPNCWADYYASVSVSTAL